MESEVFLHPYVLAVMHGIMMGEHWRKVKTFANLSQNIVMLDETKEDIGKTIQEEF